MGVYREPTQRLVCAWMRINDDQHVRSLAVESAAQ